MEANVQKFTFGHLKFGPFKSCFDPDSVVFLSLVMTQLSEKQITICV